MDPTPAQSHDSPLYPKHATAWADLHLHTHFSDGTFTPAELALRAYHLGASTIALTDHDTVEGCAPTAAACAELGIEFIAGTELTAECDGAEIHLLGYFLDTAHPRLLREMAQAQEIRQRRVLEMVARLNQIGIPIHAETVLAIANCQSPGRPHLARALVQERLCNTVDEAFERFLRKDKPGWVPKLKIAAPDAIRLIHDAGGLAVLAHPGISRVDDHIPALAANGLDGIECLHSKHSARTAENYRLLADRFDLAVTGGSDCHGMTKGKPLIGSVRLPAEYLARLKLRRRDQGSHPHAGSPSA